MRLFYPEGRIFHMPANRAALSSPAALADACARELILEARALRAGFSHDLIVDLGCMKGIIPREEGALGIREGTVRDIALISRVNKSVSFVVTGFARRNGETVALLSRRRAQELCEQEYLSALVPGDVVEARVTHLEPFGAFCDVGCGISSLIPIDAISVSRIFHPSDRFRVGDEIRAVVRSRAEDGRLTLSHKELLGTWLENANTFTQGETVSGIIRTVEDYGAFVELTPNLAGLAEPRPGICAGQQASVYIKSILPEKMKVKLIIIDAFDADYSPAPPHYFFTGTHLDRWDYSPPGSTKAIGTVFGEE